MSRLGQVAFRGNILDARMPASVQSKMSPGLNATQ